MIIPIRQTHFISRFQDLAFELAGFAKEANVTIRPIKDRMLSSFSARSEQEQERIVQALQVSVKICRETRAQGHKMNNSPALTWQALKEFRLQPTSDFFAYLDQDLVVEIYSKNNVQLFRSFNFFEFCSYSLEELYCEDWATLYSREDERVLSMIYDFTQKILDGSIKNTISLDGIPPHVVREVNSIHRNKVQIQIHRAAPLFYQGTSGVGGFIALESIVNWTPSVRSPENS